MAIATHRSFLQNRIMSTAYLSTAYFAPVSYYASFLRYDRIVIEQWCNYTKQTYRNRCHIAGANGLLALSVPIVKPNTIKCPTKDIRISDHGEWRHLHWNAIASAYGSSPFFEYYQDDIRPFFEKRYEFLLDFNEEIRRTVCNLIGLEPHIEYSSSYSEPAPGETDLRECHTPQEKKSRNHLTRTTETLLSSILRKIWFPTRPEYHRPSDEYGSGIDSYSPKHLRNNSVKALLSAIFVIFAQNANTHLCT